MQSVIWKEPLHARGAGTRPTPQLARVLKQALMGAMLIKKTCGTYRIPGRVYRMPPAPLLDCPDLMIDSP